MSYDQLGADANDDVFLVFVDAAAHSTIVSANPRDRAGQAFDLLQERVTGRLRTIVDRHRCTCAQLWRWAGDGGFLAIHDEHESVARDIVFQYARSLVDLDLRHLRDELVQLGIAGELHIRIAVHRGVIRHRGDGLEGLVYSPDLNYGAHLEEVTPPDTVAISEDVYRVAGPYASAFEHVGTHEDKRVYLATGSGEPGAARRAWLITQGLAGGNRVHAYHERPSQREKAKLVAAATEDVLDLGMALRTASHYLVTTERPAYFRDAVIAFLRRGGRYRCVTMEPDARATEELSKWRGEDMSAKITTAVAEIRRFKERVGPLGERVEVYHTDVYPAMASMAIDLDHPHALILTSPYLASLPDAEIDLCEMPHYLLGRASGRLFERVSGLIAALTTSHARRVI